MRGFLAIGCVLLGVLAAFEPRSVPEHAAPQITATPSLVPSPTPSTLLPLNPTTQASIGDPYYPALGNGGYDVQHYDLALDVDVAHNIISGTATISAQASANLTAFNLDLSGLTVGQVAVGGAAAAWSRAGQELTITPTVALAAGQIFTSTVRYGGTPQPVTPKAIALPMGWVHYDKGIYVAGEPEGAATWRPVNDHPLDKATYTIQITVPDPYVAVANGVLQQTTHIGSNTTYRWTTAHPLASYLVTVDIAKYAIEQAQGPGDLPIRNVFPVDIVPQAQSVFAPTADMIAYFSSVFGPYPFEAYGVVVVDHDMPFALETQTLSLFGRNVAVQDPGLSEDVVAHELAHQWFGDSVSLHTWQDIWLNESFATYATWLWKEHTQGPGTIDRIAQATYTQIQTLNLAPTGLPPANDLFSTSVYERGALVLQALRLRIGDDAFFRTLQAYTARHRDGNASTPDFIAVAEQTSSQDLHAFFHQWLYQQALPPLKGYRLFVPLF